MNVFNPIGSKQRFHEIFQGVNKMKLNENFDNPEQSNMGLLEKAFNELKNQQANIKQTNTQTVDNDNFVEIITTSNDGNDFNFKFKISSDETDQDNVYSINGAVLTEFKSTNFQIDENSRELQQFNVNHSSEIMDVVSEFVDFEDDAPNVDDELAEDAMKLIDKIPYRKGSEEMQTHKSYADRKPTNPNVRVKSPELDKFVNEYEDDDYTQDSEQEDPLALPPEYGMGDMPNKNNGDDDGSVGVDPYDQNNDSYDDTDELSPEETKIIYQAYDNLVSGGNPSPTSSQVSAEANKIKGIKPAAKTRAIPQWAEPLFEDDDVIDTFTDKVVSNTYNNTLSQELKYELIAMADKYLTKKLGNQKHTMSRENYIQKVKEIALELHKQRMGVMNEDDDTYPDQIGKKFKPKNQMPRKKKRPHATVNLSEDGIDNTKYPYKGYEKPNGSSMYNGRFANDDEDYGNYAYDGDKDELQLRRKKGLSPNEPLTNAHMPSGYRVIRKPNMSEMENDPEEEILSGENTTEPDNNIEQLTKEKEEAGDMISGGLAADKSPNEFNPEQIRLGLKVEMEHTDDPLIAIEIAMDHLTEDPEYYTSKGDPETSAQFGASKDVEGGESDTTGLTFDSADDTTDELLGYKPFNVNDYSDETNKTNKNIDEELGMEEYQGNVGDKYQDAEGNDFTVSNKVNGGVSIKGQSGEKEVDTASLGLMKKLSESKNIITEQQIKTARQALNKRGLSDGMTKKEAIQILIKHNIK